MTNPTNPGTGRWMTLGDALGYGLASGVNNFISTNNTFEQQRQQQANIEADKLFRAQQAAEQTRQWEAQQAAQAARDAEAARQFNENLKRLQDSELYNRGLDAAKLRKTDFDTILSPRISDALKDFDSQMAQFAPTINGRANPQYDPARYEIAKSQRTTLLKSSTELGKSIGSGDGWMDKWDAVASFLGLSDSHGSAALAGSAPAGAPVLPTPAASVASPSAPALAAPPQPIPQVQGQAFPALQPIQQTPVTVAEPGGAEFTYTPEVPSATPDTSAPPAPGITPAGQAPATPSTMKFPARIQEVKPSDLETANDEDLFRVFGQGGLDYARAARAELKAAREAAAAKVRADQVDFWKKAATSILDNKDQPATPLQLSAAATVVALVGKTEPLTPEESDRFARAIQDLAPQVYTAKTWQDVVNTKDDAAILAAYPMYQQKAPDVVKGFDIKPYQDRLQSKLDLEAADRIYREGQTTNLEAQRLFEAPRIENLLG